MGQMWLQDHFSLRLPPPPTESYCISGSRRTERENDLTREFYPSIYWPGDTVLDHLSFSLRHEPIDLRTLVATFDAMEPGEIEAWVRQAPTGKYSRQLWFLYETFSGRRLDLPDARSGAYVPALDPARHIVADRRNSPRHRVVDNLLGSRRLCVIVRRTPDLEGLMENDIAEEVRALAKHYDPELISRAVNFLYTKETRSSFAIEGEKPSAGRAERFAAILRNAKDFDASDKRSLIDLQGQIIDPRYAAKDWRDFQNFVGETTTDFSEQIHFICPRPEDVPGLMEGWLALTRKLLRDRSVDPIVAAAVIAFAFVFIHPFEDGNGRIHRFLIHHVLATREVTPDGLIFPVSAAILRQRHEYDNVLEAFSDPLFDAIDWHFDGKTLSVTGDTGILYRYFDATAQAEYLYGRVIDTIERDLREELGFLSVFDKATAAMREIVDMPDRRLHLFFKLCMQNGGRLSKVKRGEFPELTAAEIDALEAALLAAKDNA